MKRREFCRNSIMTAGLALAGATGGVRVARAATGSTGPSTPTEPAAPPEVTRQVAAFLVDSRFEDIPPDVIALGKKSILDGLGLALAGSVSTLAPPLKRYLEAQCTSAGKSSVLGMALRTSPRFAAFANGCFVHADDYDDTQLAAAPDRVYGLLTHPTAPVLPAVLALGEAEGRSGKEVLTAFQLGVEVECKIAEAISPRHYGDGFHTTGTIGSFGSAAACARLRGLDPARTAQALGVAAAEAGGLRENFGTMTKPFHAGHAAEAGVVAADLAALGWTASPRILEARHGFFQAAGGGFDADAIMGRLGRPWTFSSPGVSIKPYPSGSLTHPAMGEMLRLIRKHDLQPADVERIDVGGNSKMVTTLLHHQPVTGLQAKFSMEFGLAILLLERRAGLAEYRDEVVQREDVQRMIRRVKFSVHPEAERAGFDRMTSILGIQLRDGTVISGRAQFAKGSPGDPMSFGEVAEKFRSCAAFAGWPRAKADPVVELVAELERAPDLGRLIGLLRV
jgi:2-methylcitrate dehydratase PrpD